MLSSEIFTAIALIGCVVPWVTPRHFPTHFLPGGQEATVAAWVMTPDDSTQNTPEVP